MKPAAEMKYWFAVSVALVIFATTTFPMGTSTAMAQEVPEPGVHISQVAVEDDASSLPEPETVLDRDAASIWTQLHCSGLGNTDAECVLASSGRVPASADGSSAEIVQSGRHNIARIIQQGARNVLHASQVGARNELYAEQIGDGNQIAARLIGDDNSLQVQQHGDDNAYLFSFEGDGLDHSLSQVGSGLRAVQLGTGDLPFSIEQKGTDMQIRIVHDPIGGWPR